MTAHREFADLSTVPHDMPVRAAEAAVDGSRGLPSAGVLASVLVTAPLPRATRTCTQCQRSVRAPFLVCAACLDGIFLGPRKPSTWYELAREGRLPYRVEGGTER